MLTQQEIGLAQMQCRTKAKDFSEDERKRRTRDSLILCMNHLKSLGYYSSAEHLAQEAGIGTDRFELCDNISFFRVLVDFETYYEQRYGMKPKIAKPVPKGQKKPQQTNMSNLYDLPQSIQRVANSNTVFDGHPPKQIKKTPQTGDKKEKRETRQEALESRQEKRSNGPSLEIKSARAEKGSRIPKKQSAPSGIGENIEETGVSLAINATPISAQQMKQREKKNDPNIITDDTPLPVPPEYKLMQKVPEHLRDAYGDLPNAIARDIFTQDTGVTWSDIVGLNGAKRVLREAVVMPLKFPQLFAGKRLLRPWKGVLLHGPPGTGKTLLAKAVAGEGTTFFNVSASTIVSKWRGDSEKLIRVLFELARYHAPSTIFIDELDSIMSKRSETGEHEASRRMKTEMLTQMDGLAQSDALVFVLAASNFPFDLDPALLRRLEKRILVPLPEEEAREEMFRSLLTPDIADPDIDFSSFAKRTEKYSGSDIKLVCKEAAMEPLRRLMASLQEKYGDQYLDIATDEDVVLDPVTTEDLEVALSRTKPSLMYDMKKYQDWQDQFGVE